MTDFIQNLLLSDPVVFILVSIGVIAISLWSFSRREFTGYILGWLLGIFLVLLFSTIFTRSETETELSTLSFIEVFFPGLIGISLGIGLRVAYATITPTSTRRTRPIAIALSMSSLLSCGYLMLLSMQSIRAALGIFAMGIVIGILSHRVFTRQRPPASLSNGDEYVAENEMIDDLIGSNTSGINVVPDVNTGRNFGFRQNRPRQGRPPRI